MTAGDLTVERVDLDGTSWIDVVRGFVPVDAAAATHAELLEGVAWQQGRVFRYEKWIDEPRLGGWQKFADEHPVLHDAHVWLSRRYNVRFDGVALALYRNERDSVAFHRDRELRYLDNTVIAVLTFGATRPWLVKPITGGRRFDDDLSGAIDVRPASGDLLVMGGRCQQDWVHAVPKAQTRVAERISAQWRWTSGRGARDTNPGFRSARRFGDGSRGR
ncbi:MAG: alpha-ketoglutarate-dependent dioxygenase AlkB [Acidimicrobiia bacterium]